MEEFWIEPDNESASNQNLFHEYEVRISSYKGIYLSPPVVLTVWAQSFDNALNCGEILSAVYL